MHATLERCSPAFTFRRCLFSRVLFVFLRLNSNHPSRNDVMVSFFQVPDARRIRSFFTKLPLATRVLLGLFTAFEIAKAFRPGLEQWGALIPEEINIGTRKSRGERCNVWTQLIC